MTKFSKTGVIIRENQAIGLATLGNETAIKLPTLVLQSSNFRMLKAELQVFITNLTATEGFGLLLGLANNELSVAEIKECLIVDGPLDRNDRVAKERAERYVKIISQLDLGQADTGGVFRGEYGEPMLIVKPRWTFIAPEGWCWFVYNNTQSVLTTGATVKLQAQVFGLWVD